MKRVLVTAGTVYGRLDDNKLVGNRIRGIWATKFAFWLCERGYDVTLLVPDTTDTKATPFNQHPYMWNGDGPPPFKGKFELVTHGGYFDYAEKCYAFAPTHDAAVMAAAVVNWIPKEPFKGKMPTEGFREGDRISVDFILAPRVIDRMRKLNPKLTLIGCKMTSRSTKEETFRAAYQTLLKGHCNVVIANDLSNLKDKFLVYPDASRVDLNGDFDQMYRDLEALLRDEFYSTETHQDGFKDPPRAELDAALRMFDLICEKQRERFQKRPHGGPAHVFGSVAVRVAEGTYLVSPREKGVLFNSKDAVLVTKVDRSRRVIHTIRCNKATLNAPLLISVLEQFKRRAVVHLHEENPEWPTLPYGPPGSVRDNHRVIERPEFNIKGHGCVFVTE